MKAIQLFLFFSLLLIGCNTPKNDDTDPQLLELRRQQNLSKESNQSKGVSVQIMGRSFMSYIEGYVPGTDPGNILVEELERSLNSGMSYGSLKITLLQMLVHFQHFSNTTSSIDVAKNKSNGTVAVIKSWLNEIDNNHFSRTDLSKHTLTTFEAYEKQTPAVNHTDGSKGK